MLKIKTILELMDEEFKKADLGLPYNSVMDFLTDDKKSTEFIKRLTNDDSFPETDEGVELYQLSQTRARHSAISYLLGLVFEDFGDLKNQISEIFTKHSKISRLNYQYLWKITALYHDWGYFSDSITKRNINYRKTNKYYLLDDYYEEKRLGDLCIFKQAYPEAFSYSYEEIEAYDEYARQYHDIKIKEGKNEIERVDHGILGGIATFNTLITRLLNNDHQVFPNVLTAIKFSCITIAQHNIFKSDSKENDIKYGDKLKRLHSTSSHIVDDTSPLLLFLCLIDTIECVKRFSKSKQNRNHQKTEKENSTQKTYMQTKTVLSGISAAVSKDKIILDYSELYKKIIKEHQPLISEFDYYIAGVKNLGKWTSFYSEEDNSGYRIIISLNSASSSLETAG